MSETHVMIVEDEALVAADLQESLTELGYQVVFLTGSGEKALEAIPSIRPDLVLMDIQLKGQLDGIETAIRIKNQTDIPIIFLTAFAEDDLLERAKLSEPYGYLLKPFEPRELRTTIEMARYKSKMERDRKKLIEKLQAALVEIKTLRGLIPICMHCKKVRDDTGFWEAVESYVQKHTQARFSHGICPDCYKNLYQEFLDEAQKLGLK